MKFDDTQLVESVCYQIRAADWKRSQNRAAINRLFNGAAPFTEEEVEANDIQANYNDLTSTRKAHDARGQMYSSILKPGNYFRATAKIGPRHNRHKASETVTTRVNRIMKRSMAYYELQRSKIAQSVLHGIGSAVWSDQDRWLPRHISIEDLGIPSGEASELPMDGLPLFYIHKSFTAPQLIKLTRGPNVDPGWNRDVVKATLKWIDEETQQLMGQNWPVVWSQEKWEERIKEGSYYSGDQVPTIEVYDFYYWCDEGKESGWKRRMIIDPWGTPMPGAVKYAPERKKGKIYERPEKKVKGSFLYTSGDRIYAKDKRSIFACQFADLSAVAPFRYHTIRGLGFLLHDACIIQNRLSCKITEATFETLTMLMRVKSADDVQRALKANLFNRGFVDETVSFIGQADRWQVNTGLVEFGWQKNRELIDQGSSTMSQNQDMSKGIEKGQLQIMAELNATTAMLSAGMQQYYQYQSYEYREILRRFMNPSSTCNDPDVKEFRGECLAAGVTEEQLNNSDGWEVEPERVLGAGNKTMEMAMSQQLLGMRPMYDPGAQRKILRDVTTAVTDDSARALELVPEEPTPSNTVHDTELVFNALMSGTPVTPTDGLNPSEAAGTTLELMEHTIQEVMQSGGVGTPAMVHGLTMAAGYAVHFIKILEADKESAAIARVLNQKLGTLGNAIKQMAQQQQEAAQAAAQQNGGPQLDPVDAAKIAATDAMAKNKIALAKESHAQKTAQRQISFEQKMRQDAVEHGHGLVKDAEQHLADIAATDLEARANARRTAETPAPANAS